MNENDHAEAKQEAKYTRGHRKSSVTRLIRDIERLILEGNKEQVTVKIVSAEKAYAEFSESDNVYVEYCDEKEAEENERYYGLAHSAYVTMIREAKRFVGDLAVPVDEVRQDGDVRQGDDLGRAELLSLMNLPKVELQPYDGKPSTYYAFMAAFDETVDKVAGDGQLKLLRLMQYTVGPAKESIESCALLGGNEGYDRAKAILAHRFGNHHVITGQVIDDLVKGSNVRTPAELRRFADTMANAEVLLTKMNALREVDTQKSIGAIVDRLPQYVRTKWRKKALQLKRSTDKYPGFDVMVKFVSEIADDANDPVYGYTPPTSTPRQSSSRNASRGSSSVSFASSVHTHRICIVCKRSGHRPYACDTFKQKTPEQRRRFIRDHELCEICFQDNHSTERCYSKYVCKAPGCGRKHSRLIHVDTPANNPVTNACQNDSNTTVQLPVVPVRVNDGHSCYALLDTASTNSFVTNRLINSLGIQGSSINYDMNTLNGVNSKISRMYNLNLKSTDGSASMCINNVILIDSIPYNHSNLDITMYNHLREVAPNLNPNIHVDLLIGQDNSEALIPLQVLRGKPGEPFAVRTLFGWGLNGRSPAQVPSKQVVSHFITLNELDVPDTPPDEAWRLGVSSVKPWSQEDRKVVELWDNESCLIDGHWQVPIPWKPEKMPTDTNRYVAHSRLMSLKNSLNRRGLYDRYDSEIRKLNDKGHAEAVDEDVGSLVNTKVWYLPHQAVVSEKKPGKLRVVFDCASQHYGKSLNDYVLQGPDLNNDLSSVLLRFRQHHYALMADVEGMYNQVRLPAEDRDALRFLWFQESDIVCFRMTSHLFGGIWCSSCSTYALRKSVLDADHRVKSSVNRCFYVDDYLVSCQSRDQIEYLLREVPKAVSSGGFRLTKFVVNDSLLLGSIPEVDRAKEVCIPEASSKVLGLRWSVEADEFFFEVNIPKTPVLSRRLMLHFVCSIFDPLGFLGFVTLIGRLLFQEATFLKLSWDEEVPPYLKAKWDMWVSDMSRSQFVIPRCIKPSKFDNGSLELHCFSDASQKAYGCCIYLRCVSLDGQIHSSLICSKARVAPSKTMTIPRLELQAALLSVQVESVLRQELDLSLDSSCFWVDSEIVLCYIKNESRRFHVFVANRVGAILRLSFPDQWHHISGKQNPADVISRGASVESFDDGDWLRGPNFLRETKGEWKSSLKANMEILEGDVETKQSIQVSAVEVVKTADHPVDVLARYYSDWYKFVRAVAWLVRVRNVLCHRTVQVGHLSSAELARAEVIVLRHVQLQSYPDLLSKGSTSGPLRKLCPVVDDDGLIRISRRISQVVGPVVVPHTHKVAELICRKFHNFAHLGSEWVLSLVRKHYWVTKARVIIRRVSRSCLVCKKLFGKTGVQKMSDLPPDRIVPGLPPFTNVGLDCFGPFYVKSGRSEVKRYGCLFTCFTCRAIHLEVLSSMETDSFINAFRRFIARRGVPAKLWSDNGTNFVGAKEEINKSLQEVCSKLVKSYATKQNIEWSFNPPTASHMGGVWERMIRTVRKVLTGMLVIPTSGVCKSDEVLVTLFCEIEAMVNGRPLTKVSSDADDVTPLTPNHILLLREGTRMPPGHFVEQDVYRRRWRQVQYMADVFWTRWLREYLPELDKRTRWLTVTRNFQVGDLVLVLCENTPRSLWPLGLVVSVSTSDDGLVRSVEVKTKSTVLRRPINKLVFLEGQM